MSNKEIARQFNLLGKIMELHGENPFKYRSYYKAYNILRKVEAPLTQLSQQELMEIEGVGKNIANKIVELSTTGVMSTLVKFQDQTPVGVQEMLLIRGFGPKKVKTVWEGLGVETIGELLYACNENRLVKLKGFGAKTQETLREQLEYHIASSGKAHLASVWPVATALVDALSASHPNSIVNLSGDLRRLCNVVDGIDLVSDLSPDDIAAVEGVQISDAGTLTIDGNVIRVHDCTAETVGTVLAHTTGPVGLTADLSDQQSASEVEVFAASGIPFILPELRDYPDVVRHSQAGTLPKDLITTEDIKGIVHNHSTYSDGIHTLRQMAEYVRSQGYAYFVISDHSKYAAYANGMDEDRVLMQQREIDELNEEMAPFKIFKSIECDILPDGSLDYSPEVLDSFDLIVSSVHSNLKMTETKAMDRLIRAIASPYTHILGHMTGRLLLSRQGYPVDHRAIIDACADYGVAIELNANPYRLDMDWSYIPYAIERGVKISINPDAHSREAIHYVKWGVAAARKGGLTPADCLNAMDLPAFDQWVAQLPS